MKLSEQTDIFFIRTPTLKAFQTAVKLLQESGYIGYINDAQWEYDKEKTLVYGYPQQNLTLGYTNIGILTNYTYRNKKCFRLNELFD